MTITTATLLDGLDTWAAPMRGVCTYCASAGRGHDPVMVPPPMAGRCRTCGEDLESTVCVPGEACDPGHGACEGCRRPAEPCDACRGEGVHIGACVFCHGTGRVLANHCCDCGGYVDCGCPVFAR